MASALGSGSRDKINQSSEGLQPYVKSFLKMEIVPDWNRQPEKAGKFSALKVQNIEQSLTALGCSLKRK